MQAKGANGELLKNIAQNIIKNNSFKNSGSSIFFFQSKNKFIPKKNTKEKFGPVRTVTPGLVFEIAFEGIQASPRHKSGIALRFPRIARWRKDKTIEQANSIQDLKALLP